MLPPESSPAAASPPPASPDVAGEPPSSTPLVLDPLEGVPADEPLPDPERDPDPGPSGLAPSAPLVEGPLSGELLELVVQRASSREAAAKVTNIDRCMDTFTTFDAQADGH